MQNITVKGVLAGTFAVLAMCCVVPSAYAATPAGLVDPAKLTGRAADQVLEFTEGLTAGALQGFEPQRVEEEDIEV